MARGAILHLNRLEESTQSDFCVGVPQERPTLDRVGLMFSKQAAPLELHRIEYCLSLQGIVGVQAHLDEIIEDQLDESACRRSRGHTQ